jgi:hypothetical protein
MQQAKQNPTNEVAAKAEQADNQTETAEQHLADVLKQLFDLYEGDFSIAIPFNMSGEAHTLTVNSSGSQLEVWMASRKGKIEGKYQNVIQTLNNYRNSEEMKIPVVKEEFDILIEPVINELRESQIQKHIAAIEGKNSKQAMEVENQCRTDAQKLVHQIVAWGTNHGIADLSPEAVKKRLDEEMKQRRSKIVQEVKVRLGAFASKVKEFDPAAELEFRGSLATGQKTDGSPFNPSDFDVDAFVKSDLLWQQAIEVYGATPQNGKIWANTSGIPGFGKLAEDMFNALKGLTGMRNEFSLAIRSVSIAEGLRKKEPHIRIPSTPVIPSKDE